MQAPNNAVVHSVPIRRYLVPGHDQWVDDMIYLWFWTLKLYGKARYGEKTDQGTN